MYKFNYAKITKSRLMGSMGLIVVSSLKENEEDKKYEYFLLDSEGLGLADYISLTNPDDFEVYEEEERLMGGLGSKRIDLSEEEAKFLIHKYANKNAYYQKPLPEGIEEYEHYMQGDIDAFNINSDELFKKLCAKYNSDIEFVNYIVMRFISMDREFLRIYSMTPNLKDMSVTNRNGTLLRNEVRKIKENHFMCETLFEDMDRYYKVNLAIKINTNYMIESIMIGNLREVDPEDVLDDISRNEYIGVYKIKEDIKEFKKKFVRDYPFCLKCQFEKGIMLTKFYEDNSHVNKKVYEISNDIEAIYYLVGDYLIVSNYHSDERIENDKEIFDSYSSLELKDEFVFMGSVIYEFANSDYQDFYEFLNS
ncbi:MAG: hypothetical protein N4A54_01715 [Peptostreptococcaceae bacterium]|nr:hypothetical protein [Peptostreptococcaceae bacterium]